MAKKYDGFGHEIPNRPKTVPTQTEKKPKDPFSQDGYGYSVPARKEDVAPKPLNESKKCKICGEDNDSNGPYCTGACADKDGKELCPECGAVLANGKCPDGHYEHPKKEAAPVKESVTVDDVADELVNYGADEDELKTLDQSVLNGLLDTFEDRSVGMWTAAAVAFMSVEDQKAILSKFQELAAGDKLVIALDWEGDINDIGAEKHVYPELQNSADATIGGRKVKTRRGNDFMAGAFRFTTGTLNGKPAMYNTVLDPDGGVPPVLFMRKLDIAPATPVTPAEETTKYVWIKGDKFTADYIPAGYEDLGETFKITAYINEVPADAASQEYGWVVLSPPEVANNEEISGGYGFTEFTNMKKI